MKLLVIADDLTGGADCQSALWPSVSARTWLPCEKPLFEVIGDLALSEPVQIIDTESRLLDEEEARTRFDPELRSFVDRWPAATRPSVYLKVDSALRGHIAASVRWAVEALGAAVVPVVVSNPRAGRVTSGGMQQIDGQAVHQTALANDPTHPVTESSVARAFTADGSTLGVRVIGSEELTRSPRSVAQLFARRPSDHLEIIVFDAESDDHMTVIGNLLAEVAPPLICGSAGLLGHMPWFRDAARTANPTVEETSGQGPILIVVGSVHPNAVDQAFVAARALGVTPVVVRPGDEQQATGSARDQIARTGCAILVSERLEPASPNPSVMGEAIARALGQVAVEVDCAARLSGCILVGGNTAFHVAQALGVRSFTTTGRVAPGMPIARSNEAAPRALVLKPGAFGGEGVLVDAVRSLGVPLAHG